MDRAARDRLLLCADGKEGKMKRILILAVVAAAVTACAGALSAAASTRASACTPTGFIRDSINLTARLINPGNVSGTVDATGCNIGVYYGSGMTGTVSKAEIFGANYFGVVNNGGQVDIAKSAIHDIGEVPFNGSQHGVAIYFTDNSGATGSITKNTITSYQKGAITVLGTSDSAAIDNNTVTGLGPVNFIAQNGIEVGDGASASVTKNNVSGNSYTGAGGASSGGILVFGGACFGGDQLTVGTDIENNTLTGNDVGVFVFQSADCSNPPATATNIVIAKNDISNDAVNNTSGNGPGAGYQAGISDTGNGDSITKNNICGLGYTPVATPPPFLFFIDITLTTSPTVQKNNTSATC